MCRGTTNLRSLTWLNRLSLLIPQSAQIVSIILCASTDAFRSLLIPGIAYGFIFLDLICHARINIEHEFGRYFHLIKLWGKKPPMPTTGGNQKTST